MRGDILVPLKKSLAQQERESIENLINVEDMIPRKVPFSLDPKTLIVRDQQFVQLFKSKQDTHSDG